MYLIRPALMCGCAAPGPEHPSRETERQVAQASATEAPSPAGRRAWEAPSGGAE